MSGLRVRRGAHERKVLEGYVSTAETEVKSFPPQFPLHPRSQFVKQVFYRYARKGALILGLNLCFDLTRLARSCPEVALQLEGKPPSWRARSQMRQMTVTTFKVLKSLHEWEGFRLYNFFLLPVLADGGYPANINPERFRLVAPFESDQTKWERLTCINIGDSKDRRRYGLTTSFTSSEFGKKAVVETFENLFYRYMQHAEAKSLGPHGKPCKSDTRGLLLRSHVIAGRHRRIGKESDRRWEEGDDLESLLFKPIEFEPPGENRETLEGKARASERLIRRIKEIGIRELVRFGCGRRILEKICRRDLVSLVTLREYERMVRACKLRPKTA